MDGFVFRLKLDTWIEKVLPDTVLFSMLNFSELKRNNRFERVTLLFSEKISPDFGSYS